MKKSIMVNMKKKKCLGGRRKGPRKPKKKVRAPKLSQVSFQGETYVVLPRDHELCTEVPAEAPAVAPVPVNQGPMSPDVCREDEIVFEDFETKPQGGLRSNGWNVSQFDYDVGFTYFLGRFGQNQVVSKKYTNDGFEGPKSLKLEFDFYEIDDWESLADSQQSPDCLYVFVDGEKLDLGIFGSGVDEKAKSGVSAGCGIEWETYSKGPPSQIGFRDGANRFKDQKHHVIARIPDTCSWYTSGTLELAFQVLTNDIIDEESGGFDNIRITGEYPCIDETTSGPVSAGAPALVVTPAPTNSPSRSPTVANDASISGNVRDDKGNPIPNVDVDLFDSDGTWLATTTTDSNGDYSFTNLPPGDYILQETNSDDFPIDVSDRDEIVDGDVGDSDTRVNNQIPVTLNPGEDDIGNNFVDAAEETSAPTSAPITPITGSPSRSPTSAATPSPTITETTGAPTRSPSTAPITPESGAPTRSPSTAPIAPESGVPTRSPTAASVPAPTDSPTESPVTTPAPVSPGTPSQPQTEMPSKSPVPPPTGAPVSAPAALPTRSPTAAAAVPTDAPVELPGSISGTVKDDNGTTLPGATIQLLDENGDVIRTVTTGTDGFYEFTDLPPGEYKIREINPPGYPNDVGVTERGVTLLPGESDDGNDFVDSRKGIITGSVEDSTGVPLTQVTVQLLSGDNVVATTLTDNDGEYEFTDVEPGDYTIKEINPDGYTDVSDFDRTNDGDASDSVTQVNSMIGVTLTPGETDNGNVFVDTLITPTPISQGAPSQSQTNAPSRSPMTPPTASLTKAPVAPTTSPTRPPTISDTAAISGYVKNTLEEGLPAAVVELLDASDFRLLWWSFWMLVAPLYSKPRILTAMAFTSL